MCTREKHPLFYANFVGYACGIAHKVLDDMDWVFWLYIMNTFFLLVDMYLYYLYRNNKAPVEPIDDNFDDEEA